VGACKARFGGVNIPSAYTNGAWDTPKPLSYAQLVVSAYQF